tara:strand:+ start:5309 stop:6169 length:861 start_codon:yes stop_codon:yes gene_type:complete
MEQKYTNQKNDSVCGMNLEGLDDIPETVHNGNQFFFCGNFCKKRFESNPEKFQGTPLIALREVRKSFIVGNVETKVLRGLNLNIWEGDFVAIVGSSGSGKSTALNMIGLLDRPTSGSILLNGEDVSVLGDDVRAGFRSHTFGFIFQQYNLIPWLTAYENVTLPLIFSNKTADSGTLEARFHDFGLAARLAHRPFELSGGEQQRTALLRALANDPEIILGDEPTGNLDSVTGNKILEILINLNKIQKKTLIIVTHDDDIAEKADQVIIFKDGQLERNHEVQRKIYTE